MATRWPSGAKWSWVTRRLIESADRVFASAPDPGGGCGRGARRAGGGREAGVWGVGLVCPPRLGDCVVARVGRVGVHEFLEDPCGRRARLYPGDVVVGAYGNRYATDFYEGYLPGPGDPLHLLTAGGLIGTVASAHTGRAGPTELEVIGALTDRNGHRMSVEDGAIAALGLEHAPVAGARVDTVVVVGSSMNSGKTTTAAALVRGFSRAGLVVGAGKVTGSGSGNDYWSYVDAGAVRVLDFLDFGMASTFGYPISRLIATMVAISEHLRTGGAQVVVLEIADGVLQAETAALAARLPGVADAVVLAVGDALAALGATARLAELGVTVRAVSGLVTASPLAVREVTAATGLAVVTPAQLAAGAAVELLTQAVTQPVTQLSHRHRHDQRHDYRHGRSLGSQPMPMPEAGR